jgi:acyl-CoA reductase-like NAD-dependent aldehyde dehydrogenase
MASQPTPHRAFYQQYIGGAWIDAEGGRVYDDFDPYGGSIVARIPNASRVDIECAVDAAAKAFPAWAALPPIAKQRLFLRAADIVERRILDLVAILARETGCGRGFAMFQIQWTINLLRQVSNWVTCQLAKYSARTDPAS